MANQEHLKILRRGVPAWNEWREKNPESYPTLPGTTLPVADLSGASLTGAFLPEANLIRADLNGAFLPQANGQLANGRTRIASLRFARFC